MFCAKTHWELKKTYSNILTIIIPRHINRIKKITNELSGLNLKISLYSDFEQLNSETDILLVNTYGEALKFYQISKSVFLGKSLTKNLIKDSGQNPIEPSLLGCKIFHGPNVSNFDEVYKYLNSLGVTNKIQNHIELSRSLVEEFKNEKPHNKEIIEKIEKFGENTFNNVLKEIKTYIDNQK